MTLKIQSSNNSEQPAVSDCTVNKSPNCTTSYEDTSGFNNGCPFWKYVIEECERQWNEVQQGEYGSWNDQSETDQRDYFQDMYRFILEKRDDVIKCGDVQPPGEPSILAWELSKFRQQTDKFISFLVEHDNSAELYSLLHNELKYSNSELEEMGFHFDHCSQPDQAPNQELFTEFSM